MFFLCIYLRNDFDNAWRCKAQKKTILIPFLCLQNAWFWKFMLILCFFHMFGNTFLMWNHGRSSCSSSDFDMFVRHWSVVTPYRRHNFFVSEIFLDPRSALILKQSKQSGPLSLAFPSYPRPILNPLSSYSHSCE